MDRRPQRLLTASKIVADQIQLEIMSPGMPQITLKIAVTPSPDGLLILLLCKCICAIDLYVCDTVTPLLKKCLTME
jgi:hypothetical protein